MSKQIYFEKIQKERYVCHSCGKPLPESPSDIEWKPIVLNEERLDFHSSCLWKHLNETWIPYKI